MKNYNVFIGIDVSKETLDIIGINDESEILLNHQIISNKVSSIKSFFKKASVNFIKDQMLVTYEDTGIYSNHLDKVFSLLKINYCKVSALEIKKSKGLQRGKSDKDDAKAIAYYALSHKNKMRLSEPLENNILHLRVLYSQREKIITAIQTFNSNKELDDFIPKSIIKDLAKTQNSIINNLKKNLKTIDDQINKIIHNNTLITIYYDLINTIPGIGTQTAVYLIIATRAFTRFSNSRQLACYCGIAPFPYESGTSIKGKNKVSQFADKKLKTLLNMCALNAKKYDPQIKLYFDKKLKEGKNKMLILNNIRNKLVHRVFAVIKRQQPYVITHTFAA
ncbi:IS110 family transposase [Plebeiibacterium sediminum]|uniref:IS110 family transposase n=1 Tax=Plebeiibacterium sediminum TaxID=2992112 RepID=A0AAE3SHG7_9BACT|nr:IS110 family transposase [Plebeiobacterium sediminum]MCW3789568.1 IS110 family transposase [Plebeiobacterium sediminum]